MIDRIKALAAELHPELVRTRRHLHAHPELSFQEDRTAAFVAEQLKALDAEVRAGVAGTGVIGLLRGEAGERAIALRADMDALPIAEANTFEHRSANAGVMHACGHDVHMSCVLGAARILHAMKSDWCGTVLLVFQPGEERIPGGASLLLKEGALNDPAPSAILGQHVTPELEVGRVGFREGPFMASSDELYVTVKGRGGHAAQPEKLIDPIVMASHLMLKLKEEFNAVEPAQQKLLAFGRVIAEGATNVVPDEVKIAGTLRAFDEPTRERLHHWLPRRANEICASFGGSCDFEVRKGYPVLVNDLELTRRMKNAAIEYLGGDKVVDMDRRMGSEDFAFYTHAMPGCFYRLGTGVPGQPMRGLHTPTFDIDEDGLRIGSGLLAWGAVHELG